MLNEHLRFLPTPHTPFTKFDRKGTLMAVLLLLLFVIFMPKPSQCDLRECAKSAVLPAFGFRWWRDRILSVAGFPFTGGVSAGGDPAMANLEAGFAKLEGEDFEYYMQTYSIILGRNSKKSAVDVDLAGLGGGMNISRQHARIYYDFDRRRFALEVLGKNGCFVEGVLYLPGHPPIKLDSQDLLQIGDKKFYFLLPFRSIVKPPVSASAIAVSQQVPAPGHVGAPKKRGAGRANKAAGDEDGGTQPASKKGRKQGNAQDGVRTAVANSWPGHDLALPYCAMAVGAPAKQGFACQLDQKGETRRRIDYEADNPQQMQAEEKDVVSAVATVLSDLCGPGEWMPMAKLHSELLEHYSGIWHQSRIRRFLTLDDWPASESKGRPWVGLLALLRKYPEHFVINTRSKGRMTAEFVSLVSLLS